MPSRALRLPAGRRSRAAGQRAAGCSRNALPAAPPGAGSRWLEGCSRLHLPDQWLPEPGGREDRWTPTRTGLIRGGHRQTSGRPGPGQLGPVGTCRSAISAMGEEARRHLKVRAPDRRPLGCVGTHTGVGLVLAPAEPNHGASALGGSRGGHCKPELTTGSKIHRCYRF